MLDDLFGASGYDSTWGRKATNALALRVGRLTAVPTASSAAGAPKGAPYGAISGAAIATVAGAVPPACAGR